MQSWLVGQKKLFELGEELRASLGDFCEAHYGAPQSRIVREALKAFIEDQLAAELELRKRFDRARERRLSKAGQNIRVLDVGPKAR